MSTISAIICTYNREKYIGKALESIRTQSLDKNRFQIVIVNNNSTDNTENICQDYIKANPGLSITYVNEQEQGLSAARNRGISESDADYLTFVDDDARLDPRFLELTCAYLDSNPVVVAVGGKILLEYESKPPAWENRYLNSLLGYFNPGDKSIPFHPPGYPRGSNMSFRASVFDQAGLFSTEFGRKGNSLEGKEEKELFSRIFELGYSVHYIPEAIVYHTVPHERTTSAFIRSQAIGTGQSEKKYMIRHGCLLKMYISEAIKWLGSIVLFIFYLTTLRPAKGWMILRFRFWVNRGMCIQV